MSASYVHRSFGRAERERLNGLRGIPCLSVHELTRVCTAHGVTGLMASELLGCLSGRRLSVLGERALLGRPRSRKLLDLLRQLQFTFESLDDGEEVVGEAVDRTTVATDTLSVGPSAADTVAATHPSESSSGTSDSDIEMRLPWGFLLPYGHVPSSDRQLKQRLLPFLEIIFRTIQELDELDCHSLPMASKMLAEKVKDLGVNVTLLVWNMESDLNPGRGGSSYRRLRQAISCRSSSSFSDSDGESRGPEDMGTGGKRKLLPITGKAQPGPHMAPSPSPNPPLGQQSTEEAVSQSAAIPLGSPPAEADRDKGVGNSRSNAVGPLIAAAEATATGGLRARDESGENEGNGTEAQTSDGSSLESTSSSSCCGSGSGVTGFESAVGSSHSTGTSASNCSENIDSSCGGGGGGDNCGLGCSPAPGSREGDAACRQDGDVGPGNCAGVLSSVQPVQDEFLNRIFEILRFDEEPLLRELHTVGVCSMGPWRPHGEGGPFDKRQFEAETAAQGERRAGMTGGDPTCHAVGEEQQDRSGENARGVGSSGRDRKKTEFLYQKLLRERAHAYVGAVTAAAFKDLNLHRALGRHRSLGLSMWLRDVVKSMETLVDEMQGNPRVANAEGWQQLWADHRNMSQKFLMELRSGLSMSEVRAAMRRHVANSLLEAPGQPDREDWCRMAELNIKLQLDLRDVAAAEAERLTDADPRSASEPLTSPCPLLYAPTPCPATVGESSAESTEDECICWMDQELAPLWLRLAHRSLGAAAAATGRKPMELVDPGSNAPGRFHDILDMCMLYEKDLAVLVLVDDDVCFGAGGELQQRQQEPPPVTSVNASETWAQCRQPRIRSGKAGGDAATEAAGERGAVASARPALARSGIDCELLTRRFEYRWPVVVVGAVQLAALLRLQAMYFRLRRRSGHVAMWVPLALKPPARGHSAAQQSDQAAGSAVEADGRASEANQGCRDSDPYQPGPGSPACLAIQFLSRTDVAPLAHGMEVEDWSFNALYCEVHRKVRKHGYAALQCDSVEDVQLVALVAAKVRDDMLTNHLKDVACITQVIPSEGEIREWRAAITRRSTWLELFRLTDDGRRARLGRLTILVVALRSRQGTSHVKTELMQPRLTDMEMVVERGGTVLRARARGAQQRQGGVVRRVKLP
ncbi:hypothetical protein Vretifemale_4737 [Volvox reticuliferus]|uniref:Uncharacterized protein n=1 Tax=Volvox reticuliferus TaxID=1737510 RepID=A0A8J4C7P0_9CHLO|nr:hypothetical protein Vretifemale_4737 [Volvox reticuliferus]